MQKYNIAVLGEVGSGKSSLACRFVHDRWVEELDPTIEDMYSKTVQLNGTEVQLEVLDSGGREEFSSLREQFMPTIHAAIMCIDITNKKYFDTVDYHFQKLDRERKVARCPVILVATKSDLADKRAVSDDDLRECAKRQGCASFRTVSAKNNSGIENLYKEIVDLAAKSAKKDAASLQGNTSKSSRAVCVIQ